MTITSTPRRVRRAPLVLLAAAAVLAAALATALPRTVDAAEHLEDYPLRITYELQYQQTPDRSQPLAVARAEWDVRSLSDWDFSFLTGPDAGTVYSLRPDGTFTSTDGRTTSSTPRDPGIEMVPLPDMGFDTKARLALFDLARPGIDVDRAGPLVVQAVADAAAASGLPAGQLAGATVTRESSVDAFDYDAANDDWVGVAGTVSETVVVDTASQGILLREIVFEGELIRRVVVVGVERLG